MRYKNNKWEVVTTKGVRANLAEAKTYYVDDDPDRPVRSYCNEHGIEITESNAGVSLFTMLDSETELFAEFENIEVAEKKFGKNLDDVDQCDLFDYVHNDSGR
jgi:hypothetical protein